MSALRQALGGISGGRVLDVATGGEGASRTGDDEKRVCPEFALGRCIPLEYRVFPLQDKLGCCRYPIGTSSQPERNHIPFALKD